jgi:serine/threonine protein kinase
MSPAMCGTLSADPGQPQNLLEQGRRLEAWRSNSDISASCAAIPRYAWRVRRLGAREKGKGTMPSATTSEEFIVLVRKAGVVDERWLASCLERASADGAKQTPRELADLLVQEGLLTKYQASLILKGSVDSFRIGPYRILERLGFGAMSNVYLCKHQTAPERVAVKVLTALQAKDPVSLKRFYREARATAKLDHPNIVRVHDADWDGETNFLVMDFVDGSSVQDIVQHFGPMDVSRAAHYIRQAAYGLQYAHEHGLIHRDIKPGNVLVNREGEVKILDMGLARMIDEQELEALTKGEVLGSPEYLAPEQAVDSHNVDIRADIYALGATFYFMLTGKAPYSEEKSAAGRLLSKTKRPPKPIASLRGDVPAALVAIVDRMMGREPAERYQTPEEVADALGPWDRTPVAAPAAREMPQLSMAALQDKPSPKKTAIAIEAAPALPEAVQSKPQAGWVQGLAIVVLGIMVFVFAWALFSMAK